MRESANARLGLSLRSGAMLGATLAPGVALAHGPPEWLFWPTVTWFLSAAFVLFVGSSTLAAARSGRDGTVTRSPHLVVCVATGLGALGLVLAVVLAAQGPWSTWFAIAVGCAAALLCVLALVARGIGSDAGRPRPTK
jgi:peptidoglycan/LPS O-acetylase OafA/YrhL